MAKGAINQLFLDESPDASWNKRAKDRNHWSDEKISIFQKTCNYPGYYNANNYGDSIATQNLVA